MILDSSKQGIRLRKRVVELTKFALLGWSEAETVSNLPVSFACGTSKKVPNWTQRGPLPVLLDVR